MLIQMLNMNCFYGLTFILELIQLDLWLRPLVQFMSCGSVVLLPAAMFLSRLSVFSIRSLSRGDNMWNHLLLPAGLM